MKEGFAAFITLICVFISQFIFGEPVSYIEIVILLGIILVVFGQKE